MHRGNTTPAAGTEGNPSEDKFFTVGIFGMNISKYGKLIVESYICDNLCQIYRFY